jgi:hypothetical protein
MKRNDAAAIARRLQVQGAGPVCLPGEPKLEHSRVIAPAIRAIRSDLMSAHPEGYGLTIDKSGVRIEYHEIAGLRAAVATLRQLLRQYGRRLPCLEIRDWPDFPRRGLMLDVSRGRVPKLETLLDLVEHLADFKINELQLYTEHTFAYREFKPVWRDWGALTPKEIRVLDARCRELGIDLVPNQNSFGHLREFLSHPPLRKLAEVDQPYESADGSFLRYPSTLAPVHPGTLPFLCALYDELLPHFSSGYFNIGCDETWDLGRGQSKALCARLGKGRVYLDFLKTIHREVTKRGKRMMFWGDIILHYRKLIHELPPNLIALNWGYEADHPFEKEAAQFAKAKIPFYVCPGTSTWQTLVGRHDNAFANLTSAARAGRRHGAAGYLVTDWGDGGHPQPLAVSWPLYLFGAGVSWCASNFDERMLLPVLSRDILGDPGGRMAKAGLALGLAHRKLRCGVPNETPLGTVIAAPPPDRRELFCRNGLTHYRRISAGNILACLRELERQRTLLNQARPQTEAGEVLQRELDLAARMAEESCRFMLWQRAIAADNHRAARNMARHSLRRLRQLEREFSRYWPRRNKSPVERTSAFLRWRINDYRAAKPTFLKDKASR